MNRIVMTLVAFTFLVAGVGSGVAAAERATAPAPSATRGRQLFLRVGCVHCHGTEGQGSSAGTRLAPDSLPAAAIAQFIRATNTTMPAYSAKVLSDADVADIAAFLATIPPARPADSIPALRDLGTGRQAARS
jgi:mono/diheme cytochrome c family protein